MITISKLQDKNGYIKIAAFDHRDSLKKFIAVDKLADFKSLLAETFADTCTAILVDPEYGSKAIKHAKESGVGLLLTREKTGYTNSEDERSLELYGEEYDSAHLKKMGADAVKLHVYYNHKAGNYEQKMKIIKNLYEEAHAQNLPLLVEPVTYLIKGEEYIKGEEIVKAATDVALYADVLKVEFPADITNLKSAAPFLDRINDLGKPWIILSLGMEYEHYKEACQLAKDHGASGYAVGRAAWQEVSNYKEWNDIEKFIKTTAKDRMKELSKIF